MDTSKLGKSLRLAMLEHALVKAGKEELEKFINTPPNQINNVWFNESAEIKPKAFHKLKADRIKPKSGGTNKQNHRKQKGNRK